MKINKTLIILSLLLIFCINLGAVSAADNADMSVNDINNNDVTTVESSVNVNDEISTVSEGEIHNSSEIYDNISSATGTYNITTDYQIDTTWIIPNANVIIEGNNHTIYGNGKQAFNITGNNVTIKNLNFVNCSATGSGGAIYFGNRAWNGRVSGCYFVNCSASDFGGAIYFMYLGCSVSGCCFVGCNAATGGGAIYFNNFNVTYRPGVIYSYDSSVNYCIFDNNTAKSGSAIYFVNRGSVDANYNFFAFQDNIAQFPSGLIKGTTPNNWVVLKGYSSGDKYIANFVLNKGYLLKESMPDYTTRLVIGSEEKIIIIHNNTFSCEYDPTKAYNIYSLNTGKLLTSLPSNSDNGSIPLFKPKVILTVDDIKGVNGSTVKVNVGVHDILGTPINEGTVTISLNGKEYTAKVVEGIATFDIIIPSKEGIYTAKVLFNGEGTKYDNTTCDFTVTSILEDTNNTDNNTKDINNSVVSNKINNMENCGNPLIALLIALISLPLIRRK